MEARCDCVLHLFHILSCFFFGASVRYLLHGNETAYVTWTGLVRCTCNPTTHSSRSNTNELAICSICTHTVTFLPDGMHAWTYACIPTAMKNSSHKKFVTILDGIVSKPFCYFFATYCYNIYIYIYYTPHNTYCILCSIQHFRFWDY